MRHDIDKDGVPELLVRFGDCEAADPTQIYTFRDGETVLAGKRPLVGVSADGFGGDTGEMGLGDYLAPGGVDLWAEIPQTVSRLTWLDADGDGCTDCVLALTDEAGSPDQYVVLSLQGETVYACCVNCFSGSLGTDGVFRDDWGSAFALSFRDRQCCLYTPETGTQAPEAGWQVF